MKYLIKNKYWNIVEDYVLSVLLFALIDRPTEIVDNNIFIWYNDKNQRHRDYDLPYHVETYKVVAWAKNGYSRRDDKPAEIRNTGHKKYY